uniref:Uncharacterized protein n=1 Tax=viral metagenome TaxID=1070528 RepID=A0A6H1ZUQ2_9ZZZZ
MSRTDFVAAISNHKILRWGRGPRDDKIYIVCLHQDNVHTGWELEPDEVFDQTWETLEMVLTSKRHPKILRHISRIVGYFSDMQNWNGSKLREGEARRRGSYSVVPGAAVSGAELPRDVVEEQLLHNADRAQCALRRQPARQGGAACLKESSNAGTISRSENCSITNVALATIA